jgi:hypothetical protein
MKNGGLTKKHFDLFCRLTPLWEYKGV